nr:unnamed protein product [Spirometra erinaceieuropaei]
MDMAAARTTAYSLCELAQNTAASSSSSSSASFSSPLDSSVLCHGSGNLGAPLICVLDCVLVQTRDYSQGLMAEKIYDADGQKDDLLVISRIWLQA